MKFFDTVTSSNATSYVPVVPVWPNRNWPKLVVPRSPVAPNSGWSTPSSHISVVLGAPITPWISTVYHWFVLIVVLPTVVVPAALRVESLPAELTSSDSLLPPDPFRKRIRSTAPGRLSTSKRNRAYMSVTVGEIDLKAYVDPAPLAVSRATHCPPLGAVMPWLTDNPATVDHIDSDPLSKSSWNRTPAEGVVTIAVFEATDWLPAASRAR